MNQFYIVGVAHTTMSSVPGFLELLALLDWNFIKDVMRHHEGSSDER
jgi:hypothetical protein